MQSVCYSWDDAPYTWMETPFTWAEGCVISKIINTIGPPRRGISKITRKKIKELNQEEKEVLINLFVRLEVDEIVFETNVNKNKNTKVKVKMKDVRMAMTEQKKVSVNIKINN